MFKQLQEARKLYYETRAKAAGEGTAYKDTTEHEERKVRGEVLKGFEDVGLPMRLSGLWPLVLPVQLEIHR